MAPPQNGARAVDDEDPEKLAKELGQCILVTSAATTIGVVMLLCGFVIPGLSSRVQQGLWNVGLFALFLTALTGFQIYVDTFGCWCVLSGRRRRELAAAATARGAEFC